MTESDQSELNLCSFCCEPAGEEGVPDDSGSLPACPAHYAEWQRDPAFHTREAPEAGRIGTYAVCSLGYIGKVERHKDGTWYGTGLSGKRWQSSKPRWLAPDALSAAPVADESLRKALTPSAETKAAYIGEFKFKVEAYTPDGVECMQSVTVPWATVKEIMATIREHAASLSGGSHAE